MNNTETAFNCWKELWETFTSWEIPVHALLVSQNGSLLWESYRPPYDAGKLHRMFSVTKSYCSLAVGSMAAEGLLSLDDPVIRYFPEYLPAGKSPHPYLEHMTIRHMLKMETCHSSTTYKQHPEKNWVESFFTTPPTHKSGQIFLYDTSSSHTLAALVKKLTGLGVLDYLRRRFLNSIGFSEDAYIISDPFGSEMGGSGLMARPEDLLITAHYIMDQIKNGSGPYADYLREATAFQTPTLHSGQTLDEQQGYGYQFWNIRNGFAMYGMGGQYVLFYPRYDLIVVTTADSQNIKGGNQKMLDEIRKSVQKYTQADFDLTHPSPFCHSAYENFVPVFHKNYVLNPSKSGFVRLSLQTDPTEGILTLVSPAYTYKIPFGLKEIKTAQIAHYNEPIASRGYWIGPDSLFIRTQIIGECVGSLTFMLRLRTDGLTLWMKKVEESCFNEFDGFAEGICAETIA